MNLGDVEILLLLLAVPFLLIFALTCGHYLWYLHQLTAEPVNGADLQFSYTLQKQFDQLGQPVLYEHLLNQPGQAPTNLEQTLHLLEQAPAADNQHPFGLVIDLSYDQLISNDFPYFIRWARAKVAPIQLIVEFQLPRHLNWTEATLLRRHLRTAHRLGIKFCVNNVNLLNRNSRQLRRLTRALFAVKFVLPTTKSNQPTTQAVYHSLHDWQAFATRYHLQLILAGINSVNDQLLAERLNVDLRQVHYL